MTDQELNEKASQIKSRLPEGKLFYSIGEVAELMGETDSTIRYWEKSFSQIRPRRDANGNRRFTPKDIGDLRIVHYLLRECGMTVDGARQRLSEAIKNNKHGTPTSTPDKDSVEQFSTRAEVINRLRQIRNFLTEIHDNL
mgnify:CR=1 FL=1